MSPRHQKATAAAPDHTAEPSASDPPPAVLKTSELFESNPFGPSAWKSAYEECATFGAAYKAASACPEKVVRVEFRGQHPRFRLQQHLLSICVNGLWRVCVPDAPALRSHVLYSCHDHVTAGHRGQKRTYAALLRLYYWPGMKDYCTAYVESCVQCRASKAIRQKPAGLLQPLVVPSRRWSHVSLDFITDLPRTKKLHDAVLVLVDSLSKMAHFVATRKEVTAEETVELLADRLIRYHGFPNVLISDRDPRFTSEVWRSLCSRFAIRRAMSSAYDPQSDGQTERVNQTLGQMIRTYVQSDEREWERLLPALELAYNCTSHSSTELSPFEVMVGENPITASNIDVIGALSPTLTPPMTKIFRQLCDRAQSHIQRAKWRQKTFADSRRREESFEVGD